MDNQERAEQPVQVASGLNDGLGAGQYPVVASPILAERLHADVADGSGYVLITP